jgi:hypothetical protein
MEAASVEATTSGLIHDFRTTTLPGSNVAGRTPRWSADAWGEWLSRDCAKSADS